MALNTIELNPGRVSKLLLGVLLILVVAQVTGLIMKFVLGHGMVFGLVPLFDFNTEQNIPTLFNTLLFFINASLLWMIWKDKEISNRRHWVWLILSMVFLLLGADEFCRLHERLTAPLHSSLDTTGLLFYAWVIPYGIAALLLTIFFLPVWWRLEPRSRLLLSISAFLYITGAIVLEMVGGREFEQLGEELDLKCGIYATIEESLEMEGLILFIYTQMRMLILKNGKAAIIISNGDLKG
jgi:hypothetical protein